MRLAYPWVLSFLPLLLLFHSLWVRRGTPAAAVYPLSVPTTLRGTSPFTWILALRYLAVACALFALARPQSAHKQVQRTVSGVEIMMVMDVSASMLAEDMADRSRLAIAKETMEKFIRGRKDDRIGFVIFSGEPLTLAPPTLDYQLVVRAVRDVETGVLRDGTAIGDGLSLAVHRLKESTAKSRVIVLLTDGDNNVGQVGPADAGEMAAGYGIKVYTIAIGREGRIRIPIRRKNPLGSSTVTSYVVQDNALNTELLELIAKQTQGKFYRVQDLERLEAVFEEIDRLEKTEIKSQEKVRYEEAFMLPLKLALLFLLLEQVLGRFLWRLVL
jgi:Ca-activated chloride channel family protein